MQAGIQWFDRLQEGIQQATQLADRFGVDGEMREKAATMLATRVGVPAESVNEILQGGGEKGSPERMAAIAGQAASPQGDQSIASDSKQVDQPSPEAGEGSNRFSLNSLRAVATTAASVASANPKVKVAMWALNQVDLDKVGEKLTGGQGQAQGESPQNPEAARELLTQAANDPQAREEVVAQMRDNPDFRRTLMHETGGVMNSAGPRMEHAAGQSGALNMAAHPSDRSDQNNGPKLG